jgi:hypothetical protein
VEASDRSSPFYCRATLNGVTDEEPVFETVRLWSADAVVLLDWLMNVDFDAPPISHRAQKQALMDLLTSLETDTLALDATSDEVRSAQERVARDMGW